VKINPESMSAPGSNHLFASIISPRPIAWVSTINDQSVNNLAPFSTYTLLSVYPVIVGFGVGRGPKGQKKDTLRNIEAGKEFVINAVNEDTAEAMNITSVPFAPEVSEFGRANLTPVKCDLVKPMRVGESPVSMECHLIQIVEFGLEPRVNSFVIGKVLLVHVRDDLWKDGDIDPLKFRVVGRLGGTDLYCRTTDYFVIERPGSP
jgi:flavin reductase (DIM6/NTAB) family NADH-FMN oxidoreductase RutF